MNTVVKIILLTSIAPVALAQMQMPSKKQLLEDAIQDYGAVASAWFVNKRCSILNTKESNLLEENVATITVAMRRDTNDSPLVPHIQQAALKVSTSEQFSDCGESAAMLVTERAAHASRWSQEIKSLSSANEN